ncbi:MAG: hypothetical protein AAGM22_22940, partial [Acidobacteriota bacterium]
PRPRPRPRGRGLAGSATAIAAAVARPILPLKSGAGWLGAASVLALALVLGSASVVRAQAEERPETSFADQERVTAIDLLVGLEESKWKPFGSSARLPNDFDPLKLRVERAGEVRPIVAAEDIADGLPVASEPWTFVVLVDAALSRSEPLRWALENLAQQAETLVKLGSVEVVVADPDIRVAVPLSRELRVVRSGLSQLALQPLGKDGVGDVRYAARRAQLEGDDGRLRLEPAAGLAIETARVLRQQDEALTYLSQRFADAGPRRCVFWVTQGFDVRPERFYGSTSASPATAPSGAPGLASPDLFEETRELARTLSAYGWITAPMVAPAPDALRGKGSGRRVGSLRFRGNQVGLEENRKPDRAEAYLELAAAHAGGGRHEDAADSYERAYYFFGGDPRTKDRQAIALAGLGAALERLGEDEKARKSLELAADLDPTALPSSGLLPPSGRLLEPVRAVRMVADATSGRLVRSPRELSDFLEELTLRLRVTFQVPGAPTGELQPVTVLNRRAGGETDTLRAPTWTRLGAPARIDRALVRAHLEREESALGAGIAFGGREVLAIEPVRSDGATLDVQFDFAWPASGPRPKGLRLVLAASGPPLAPGQDDHGLPLAGPPQLFEKVWTPDQVLALPAPIALTLEGRSVSAAWRDLEGGAWGGVNHRTGLR